MKKGKFANILFQIFSVTSSCGDSNKSVPSAFLPNKYVGKINKSFPLYNSNPRDFAYSLATSFDIPSEILSTRLLMSVNLST